MLIATITRELLVIFMPFISLMLFHARNGVNRILFKANSVALLKLTDDGYCTRLKGVSFSRKACKLHLFRLVKSSLIPSHAFVSQL